MIGQFLNKLQTNIEAKYAKFMMENEKVRTHFMVSFVTFIR